MRCANLTWSMSRKWCALIKLKWPSKVIHWCSTNPNVPKNEVIHETDKETHNRKWTRGVRFRSRETIFHKFISRSLHPTCLAMRPSGLWPLQIRIHLSKKNRSLDSSKNFYLQAAPPKTPLPNSLPKIIYLRL